MKKSGSIAKAPIIFALLLLVIWEGVVALSWVPRFILPAPTDVIKALAQNFEDILGHTWVTAKEAILGLSVSLVVAVFLALIMDSVALIKKTIYPIIVVSQTVPIIVLAPLIAIWFGFGIEPKIFVVALVCFFPILISLLEGLSSVDQDALNLFKSMGAGPVQIFRWLKWKGSLKSFYAGLRISATYSVMGAVIGEWVGGSKGIGFYMTRAKHSYALDKVFAAITVIVILSMLLFRLVVYLEKITMPWQRQN